MSRASSHLDPRASRAFAAPLTVTLGLGAAYLAFCFLEPRIAHRVRSARIRHALSRANLLRRALPAPGRLDAARAPLEAHRAGTDAAGHPLFTT